MRIIKRKRRARTSPLHASACYALGSRSPPLLLLFLLLQLLIPNLAATFVSLSIASLLSPASFLLLSFNPVMRMLALSCTHVGIIIHDAASSFCRSFPAAFCCCIRAHVYLVPCLLLSLRSRFLQLQMLTICSRLLAGSSR